MTGPEATLADDVQQGDGEGAPAGSARDESLIARENWERYRYGVARGHRDYTQTASRLEGFYVGGDRDGDGKLLGGGQWRREDLDVLDEQGRPAYEFNEIAPAIDAAIGYQIHNRMDIAFRPRGGDATKELAEVRSKVAMQIADNNKFHWRETEVFSDGLVQQRGYFEVRMDFDDSLLGELRVGVLDPLDVIPDPDAKTYDPAGWGDVIITRWLTLDEIEGLYGLAARRKAEEVKADYRDEADFGDMDDDGAERSKFAMGRRFWYDAETTAAEVRRIRVIDRQRWIRQLMDVAVIGTDVRVLAGDETPEALEALRARGAVFAKRRARRVKWTVSTCDTLLHDTWSPYDRFTVVPYFPKFRRGRTRGMVDNAIGPQEALNKAVSQYVHIINTTANSGWVVEEDSLTNMTTEELEDSGASTGLVIEHRKGSTAPQKIQPNQVPPGVDRIIDRAANVLQEVTVPNSMRGVQGAEESGIAIQSKQHASQQILAVPLDNLARTRAMVADWIDYAITKYYDSARVFRITKTDPLGQEVEEELAINQFDPATGQYLNDMTAGEYDVVVTEQPMMVTFENSQFQQAMEMRQAGVALPDATVVRYSNLADKHEVIQQMQGAQAPKQDPLLDAELALRNARRTLALAQAEKTRAEAVNKSVEGMFSATHAAAEIATQPAVAPLADGLLRSAGFKDQDAAPIVPQPGAPVAGIVPPQIHQNTSPQFPPRVQEPDLAPADGAQLPAPANPSVGMDAGIEGGQDQ